MVIVDFSNFLHVASKLLQGSHHSLTYCLFYIIPHPLYNGGPTCAKPGPTPLSFTLELENKLQAQMNVHLY